MLGLFIAVCTVGIIQLVKNFLKAKARKGKVITVYTIIVTAVLCLLNSELVPQYVTVIVDLFAIATASCQLAWDVLAQAFPNAIETVFNKVLDTKKGK
ncbi:MAG: hypothetical protein MJZ34_03055 [Paludibacteraceae bacterium]|nr:hypothetical protein [Paludibacteraceae bacterium]